MLALLHLVILAAASPSPSAGEVKLPLREYLALVEKAEAQEAAREKARSQVEPPFAAIVSQRVSLSLHDSDADVTTTYEIEVRGAVTKTVPLPLTGVAQRVVVQPLGPAAARSANGSLELVTTAPGHYRVQVTGRVAVERIQGSERVRFAPMTAPVAELEVSLPAERAWRCGNAVVAEEAVEAGRRRLRLALPRGEPAALEVRREARPQEPAQALASAVSLSLVSLGRDGVRRQDIVMYEVQRGEIGTMAVTLPTGLDPGVVVTDEGPATPWVEGRTLRVERRKKLTGSGYLAVASRPDPRETIALAPLLPEVKVRARYLAYSSDIAATVAPEPEASWTRVDITDLPAPVQDVAEALGIVAAWRLRQGDAGRLRVTALPGARMLDAVIRERTTTTLLTVENRLLHRDRFTVDGEGSSLEIVLPENATVWSAQVGDVPVRPVEQSGRVLIPVGLASSSARTVELVIVQERSVPPGRSTLELALPEVRLPVLRHEWRLLLPERNRYHYAGGALLPAPSRPPLEPPSVAAGARKDASAVRLGSGGTGEVYGRVVDSSGAVVQGAHVRLTDNATGRSLALDTDSAGEFRFGALPGGTYKLAVDLSGFQTASYPAIRVASGQSRAFAVTLNVGALTETVSVASEPEPLGPSQAAKRSAEEAAAGYRNEVDALKQGLVGGVKPIPVKIPESGKALSLAGALPPAHVSVSLEVRAPKD